MKRPPHFFCIIYGKIAKQVRQQLPGRQMIATGITVVAWSVLVVYSVVLFLVHQLTCEYSPFRQQCRLVYLQCRMLRLQLSNTFLKFKNARLRRAGSMYLAQYELLRSQTPAHQRERLSDHADHLEDAEHTDSIPPEATHD